MSVASAWYDLVCARCSADWRIHGISRNIISGQCVFLAASILSQIKFRCKGTKMSKLPSLRDKIL